MNVGGNQQNVPSNLPTDSTSSTPKHDASVDPNQLLLLVPDLDKRAREIGKMAKNAEQTRDKMVSDTQMQALEQFAKTLISQPDLPAGSKAALEKWIGDLNAQTTDTATTNSNADVNANAQTGTLAQPRSAQTGAQAGAGAQTGTGQTGTQTGTGTTSTTQTATGEDPNVLLMDDPKASAPVKSLGRLAQTMASSQGGKLSPEQVTLLTKEASDLFSATPGTLTDTDKAVILSFIGQLEEFPTSDDPNSATPGAKSPSSSSTTNTGASQTSQTRSAKDPNNEKLAMDTFGLSDEVRKLGQQAMSYVQGNSGKLSQKEEEQLKMAAEELIAGGADGDDLKALQNFLKALLTFPKTTSTTESPLSLTQPGINPKMVTLAQFASSMLKAQGGTLTQPEVTMLKQMAEELMSQLTPEDQAVLKTWLATLGGTKTTTPPPVNVFTNAMLFGATPKSNPFMQPGIMAMLAPILSELLEINNDIIKQSSKLKQSMMKLLVSMANEAFKFAMAAGQAKVDQLMNDAAMHMALGISSCVQAAMTAVTFGAQKQQEHSIGKKLDEGHAETKLGNWVGEKGPDGKSTIASRKNAMNLAEKDVYKDGQLVNKPGTPNGKGGKWGSASEQMNDKTQEHYNRMPRAGHGEHPSDTVRPHGDKDLAPGELNSKSFADKMQHMQNLNQKMQSSGIQTASSMINQFGEASKSFIQGGFEMAKKDSVIEEFSANAYKDMISQLMQLVTGTIQSSTEEMQAAQKNWDSFVQLYKDFANTITQGIYGR